MYWSGSSPDVLTPGNPKALSLKCKVICKYCKETPSCLALCNCKMYYVVLKDPTMSRACVHFGTHMHLVEKGECRDVVLQIWNEIKVQVEKTPTAKASAIGIAMERKLFMKELVDENSDGKILLQNDLDLIFEK